MRIIRATKDGRVTIPAKIAREVGLQGGTRVLLEVRNGEVVVQPLKTVKDFRRAATKCRRRGGDVPFGVVREIAWTLATARLVPPERRNNL